MNLVRSYACIAVTEGRKSVFSEKRSCPEAKRKIPLFSFSLSRQMLAFPLTWAFSDMRRRVGRLLHSNIWLSIHQGTWTEFLSPGIEIKWSITHDGIPMILAKYSRVKTLKYTCAFVPTRDFRYTNYEKSQHGITLKRRIQEDIVTSVNVWRHSVQCLNLASAVLFRRWCCVWALAFWASRPGRCFPLRRIFKRQAVIIAGVGRLSLKILVYGLL